MDDGPAAPERTRRRAAAGSTVVERGHHRLEAVGLTAGTAGSEAGPVFEGASLEVATGELVVVDAPSGAGSTLLLTVLAGLHPPVTGEVRFDGRPVEARSWALHRALLEQHPQLAPELTAA
ncbi:MAG TPA: ATP-binding cassette domain-containing protein, partial [Acidimicrobiales bacterium]|nr:ATP-binding cassette domain-containing protein [Acidimicrobiales bacterium]